MKILGDIREVFRTLKRRKPSRIYCPNCASPDVHLSSSFDYWLMPSRYVCDNCGYKGPVVMELEREETVDVS